MALDLQGLSKSGLVIGLARATRKIAPSRRRELCGCFANERAPARAESPHALEGLRDSLRHLGIDPDPVLYPLRFPAVEPLPGEGLWVGIAPRSRWPAKDWPEENFVALARRLRAGRELGVALLGGPADREAGERMAAEMGPPVVNLCGAKSLPELGAVLRQVNVLVCNDSGPMHYAAAVGTPLVALFGPTDPARTGPRGEGHIVLRPEFGDGSAPDPRCLQKRRSELDIPYCSGRCRPGGGDTIGRIPSRKPKFFRLTLCMNRGVPLFDFTLIRIHVFLFTHFYFS